MSKAQPAFTLFLFFLLIPLFANFISPLSSFAQTETEETLTFTTYYPAPYGVYNEMRAKRMAVGTNYYNASAYPWDIDGVCIGNEICNADLVVEGNVGIGMTAPNTALDLNGALSARGMAAPAISLPGQGRIYYDSTANKFKISENGGGYVDLIGGMRLGSWETKSLATVYQAATDGIVVAFDSTATGVIRGYTDGSNPPTTLRAISDTFASGQGITFPVKKSDYWQVTNVDYASTVYWIPME